MTNNNFLLCSNTQEIPGLSGMSGWVNILLKFLFKRRESVLPFNQNTSHRDDYDMLTGFKQSDYSDFTF